MPFLFYPEAPAGFPSPAQDYTEERLDLNELLVKNEPATFFVRAAGDSMSEAGIASGSILVVDRSLEPRNGDIVLALIDGGFTVKRLEIHGDHAKLIPAHEGFPEIIVTKDNEFQVWGVVTACVNRFRS